MDLQRARSFVREHPRAVMHTFRGDGGPQLSPVTVAIDGEGRAVVSTRETAMKVHNLRRDPAVSLCVFTERFYGEWVRIDGTATIVDRPDAIELLVDYYRRVAGEHPDWDEYRSAMVDERRVLLQIDLSRAGPDRSG